MIIQKWMSAKYPRSLRKHLMSEHIGFDINGKILDDLLNDNLWNEMRHRAKNNAEIYGDIFNCFPDNKYKLLEL